MLQDEKVLVKNKLKRELKYLAYKIKENKKSTKGAPPSVQSSLAHSRNDLRYNARMYHICYCLLRGRTMEEIEGDTLRPFHDDEIDYWYDLTCNQPHRIGLLHETCIARLEMKRNAELRQLLYGPDPEEVVEAEEDYEEVS